MQMRRNVASACLIGVALTTAIPEISAAQAWNYRVLQNNKESIEIAPGAIDLTYPPAGVKAKFITKGERNEGVPLEIGESKIRQSSPHLIVYLKELPQPATAQLFVNGRRVSPGGSRNVVDDDDWGNLPLDSTADDGLLKNIARQQRMMNWNQQMDSMRQQREMRNMQTEQMFQNMQMQQQLQRLSR